MNKNLADAASTTGIYLYGLARSVALSSLDSLAILGLQSGQGGPDLNAAVKLLPVAALPGLGASAKVVALISEVTIADFSEENVQSLAWVGARASQHEAVVALAMGVTTVLPVKFATIFRSFDSLQLFITNHAEAIEAALDSLRGKAEWSVKAYLLETEARSSIAAADSVVASRRAALPDSPGARYMQQKKIDALIEMAVEKELARVSHDLLQTLQGRAEASRSLRCHTSAVTGRSERMIFNASFLLSEDALAEFQAAVAGQQAAHQNIGLTLELRGPWPPYNFCPDLSDAAS